MTQETWVQVRLEKIGWGHRYLTLPVYDVIHSEEALVQASVEANDMSSYEWKVVTAKVLNEEPE